MTPEGEGYLSRILKAKETGASDLNLSHLDSLNQLPRELARLTTLQSLDLSFCEQLRGGLTPLASLTSLRELSLAGCEQLSGDLMRCRRTAILYSGSRFVQDQHRPRPRRLSSCARTPYRTERRDWLNVVRKWLLPVVSRLPHAPSVMPNTNCIK
jgi:hypothetical protein